MSSFSAAQSNAQFSVCELRRGSIRMLKLWRMLSRGLPSPLAVQVADEVDCMVIRRIHKMFHFGRVFGRAADKKMERISVQLNFASE